MLINKCKILVVLLLTFCIGFFINIDGVKAIGTPDGNGYSDCEYSFTVSYGSYDSSKRQYVFVITAFRNTEGNYDAYLNTMACGNPTNSQSTWQEGQCSIKNIQEMFYRDDLESKFRPNGTWSCPQLYVENPVSGNHASDVITLSYEDKNNAIKLTRVSDRSQETGSPESHSGDYDGQRTQDVHDDINEQRGAGKATIEQIKKWGEKMAGSANANELGDVGDACTLISSNAWLTAILKFILWAISIIAIIVLIIMTLIDFTKAVTTSDDTGLKKAFQHLIKRAIATVILILLPILLGWIIDIFNNNAPEVGEVGTVQIAGDGSKYCGIEE